jgi:thymidylate kinase
VPEEMTTRTSALKKPILISFSGVDGAGKSTQIANLQSIAAQHRLKTTVITFWDHIVVLSKYRERFVRKVLKSEAGIGTPGRPVERRDKNVRGWHLDFLRHGLYGLDALNVPRALSRARLGRSDVIIVDRYIYDELANLPLQNSASRTFARAISRLVPSPDIAFVLDADPEAARARKPEYPLEFLRTIRNSYLELANLLGTITVVPALSLAETTNVVELSFRRILARRGVPRSMGTWAA